MRENWQAWHDCLHHGTLRWPRTIVAAGMQSFANCVGSLSLFRRNRAERFAFSTLGSAGRANCLVLSTRALKLPLASFATRHALMKRRVAGGRRGERPWRACQKLRKKRTMLLRLGESSLSCRCKLLSKEKQKRTNPPKAMKPACQQFKAPWSTFAGDFDMYPGWHQVELHVQEHPWEARASLRGV